MANKDDYLTEYRCFFENFAQTVNPNDQLPVKLGSYKLANIEVVGGIIDWTTQYLTQKWVTLFIFCLFYCYLVGAICNNLFYAVMLCWLFTFRCHSGSSNFLFAKSGGSFCFFSYNNLPTLEWLVTPICKRKATTRRVTYIFCVRINRSPTFSQEQFRDFEEAKCFVIVAIMM